MRHRENPGILVLLLHLAAALLILGGCGSAVETPTGDGPTIRPDGQAQLQALGSHIEGQLGPVRVSASASVSAWDDPTHTSITSVVDEANGGAAMTIVDFFGGLRSEVFMPGTALSFETAPREIVFDFESNGPFPGLEPTEGDDEPRVEVIGCSGAQSGHWDWDVLAERVDVYIENIDPISATVLVSYEAVFPGDDSAASGTLTLQLP